jgi:tetratricopeptide (TPR) repeat protein
MRPFDTCHNLHKLHLMHSASSCAGTPVVEMDMEQRRVIALANHGVRLLQQRNHGKATQTLLQALNYLKECSKKRPLPEKVTEGDCQERPTIFITESLTLMGMGKEDLHCTLPFQMFQQVFTFSSSDCDPTSPENRDGSSAMILYNMALVYHSRASPSKVSLAKALQMYNYALAAIQHWARHQVVHQGCHLLRLAILNNMAHVNALLQKKAAAEHCLKCLRDILAYAKGFTTEEQYEFFTANVVVLCLKDGSGVLVKAPAAAA